MKKKLVYLGMVACLLTFGLLFAACSSEDSSGPVPESLQKTWTRITGSPYYQSTGTLKFTDSEVTASGFPDTGDKTAEVTDSDFEEEGTSSAGTLTIKEVGTFSFVVTGGTLFISSTSPYAGYYN